MEQYGIPGTGMLVTWGYRFYKTNTIAISVILIQHILKIVLFISFYFNSLFFAMSVLFPVRQFYVLMLKQPYMSSVIAFFFFFGKQLTVILKKMSFEGEWRALISILYDPLGNPLIFLEMKHSWFHSHTQTAITAIALELQKGIWKLSVAWMIMPSSFNCV